MKYAILILAVGFFSGALAHAESPSPGAKAYASLNAMIPALKAENVRAACRAFGKYEAYKSLATHENTDQWTMRNLGFNQDNDRVLSDFCSARTSTVSFADALRTAEAALFTGNLESNFRN